MKGRVWIPIVSRVTLNDPLQSFRNCSTVAPVQTGNKEVDKVDQVV